MDNTFGVWLIAAGVAAVGLLLLLGGLAPSPEGELAPELDLAEADSVDVGSSYWQPVEEETQTAQVVYAPAASVVTTRTSAPCPSCGSTSTVPAASASVAASGYSYAGPPCENPHCTICRGRTVPVPPLVGGCSHPSTPCGKPACSYCPGKPTPTVPVTTTGALFGGCGHPSTPCGPPPCTPMVRQCYDVCADPCRVQKPGINRNMPLCVDECSFIQLHSTVSHPICGQVTFEWSASKGWFLDPTASDPLFFAPTTQFFNGEDVWITLLVTDASGASYSDIVTIHVRDLP